MIEDRFDGGMDFMGNCLCRYTGKRSDCSFNPAAFHYLQIGHDVYYADEVDKIKTRRKEEDVSDIWAD